MSTDHVGSPCEMCKGLYLRLVGVTHGYCTMCATKVLDAATPLIIAARDLRGVQEAEAKAGMPWPSANVLRAREEVRKATDDLTAKLELMATGWNARTSGSEPTPP